MSEIHIEQADLSQEGAQRDVLEMVNGYSSDPLGNGKPLPAEVYDRLIEGLRKHPTTVVLLAYREEKPVGIAVCFLGFSTFAARPLLYIHDVFVRSDLRGQGVSRKLLEFAEQTAKGMGCCKLTLEVLEHNHKARQVYQAAGFLYSSDPDPSVRSLYMFKPLH